MNSQKVIFVPGHGVPEVVRSARLIAKLASPGPLDANARSPRPGPEILELWHGDFYGWHSGQGLARNSTPARIPAVFEEGRFPVVSPGKSIVAVIRNCPHGWEVEFESQFANGHGEVVHRTVTFDDTGTARERLCGPGTLAGALSADQSMACDLHPVSPRTNDMPRLAEGWLGRLGNSIAARFRSRPERPESRDPLHARPRGNRDDDRVDFTYSSTETPIAKT